MKYRRIDGDAGGFVDDENWDTGGFGSEEPEEEEEDLFSEEAAAQRH